MVDQNAAEGADKESSKKGGFDISFFLKPVADVDTPMGKFYLFSLRTSDRDVFTKLTSTETVERIRALLPYFASLSPENNFGKERTGITSEMAESLSNEMLESIAEIFIKANGVSSVYPQGEELMPLTRAVDEPATAFLERLILEEIEKDKKRSKKLREQMSGATGGIFDDVWKATKALSDTREQFERLTRENSSSAASLSFKAFPPQQISDHIIKEQTKLMRERSEDRAMVRLTGEMTAQSAKTLEELAAAASMMLDRLDSRDVQAKHTTMVQLWIAVASVIVSAVLALIALGFSVAAYNQDKEDINSGNKWQASVLDELKVANQRTSVVETSNRQLYQTIEQLREQVLMLEKRAEIDVAGSPKKAE